MGERRAAPMSLGPSAHLTWAELACHDGTPYPNDWRESRAVRLATAFEQVRAAVGAPIRIGSAYRTPAHNAAVGGARESQHCEGLALDLYPPDGWTIDEFDDAVRPLALSPETEIHGFGRYPTFLHIDVRQVRNGRCICWRGKRVSAELKEA